MRVLLDKCVPKRLANEFQNHDVSTVTKEGWNGTKNGDLLKLAASRFDVFVTVDQNLEYQQNLEESGISVVVLETESNRLDVLRPLVADVEKTLTTLKPGEIMRIGS